MKIIYFGLFILTSSLWNCTSDQVDPREQSFIFIYEYTATITVGGVVGISERAFEVGEIYEGTDKGNSTIQIRIAKHSELNNDCPNSWCYQELLDVPSAFLEYKK